MPNLIRSAANFALRTFLPEKYKEKHELSFWNKKLREEDGRLRNLHYQRFYTEFFGLSPDFYAGKRVVDIGCGPRGSLEWADMAAERVGVDSLAKEYLKLGADRQKMRYVDAGAEAMPFEDAHFDVACSFNSLDHVDDLGRAVAEIKRIVKPAGLFLLITEVNHAATATEPQCFSFDIVEKFKPEFAIVSVRKFEMAGNVYDSLGRGVPYDETDPRHRDALLAAMFERNAAPANLHAN